MADNDGLALALIAFAAHQTPTKITKALVDEGLPGLHRAWADAAPDLRVRLQEQAAALRDRGVRAVMVGQPGYPESLVRNGRTVAPVIFYWGDPDLFTAHGVGMCGSRAVSDLGLRAARASGEEVSARGLAVISGYAKGVDTETHLAALRGGGRTVIILAEGINHWRVKKTFAADFDPSRVLVLSQFAPSQPWGAYAAMARNHIIFGLGKALVVIEAGAKGGTLAAGQAALKAGRPVLVLDFGAETPPGNKLLLEAGGISVTSRQDLAAALDQVRPAAPAIQGSGEDVLF